MFLIGPININHSALDLSTAKLGRFFRCIVVLKWIGLSMGTAPARYLGLGGGRSLVSRMYDTKALQCRQIWHHRSSACFVWLWDVAKLFP